MNETNELTWAEKLEQEYIHLFETYEGEDSENPYYKPGQVLRGIEVGPGWARHTEDLLKSLDWHTKHNTYKKNPLYNPDEPQSKENFMYADTGEPNEIKIFQIKEKFGEARVYWTCDNDRISNMIEAAVGRFEGKCSVTCERCGKMGYDMIRTVGRWVYCCCDDCMKK